ncbi:MULTISPECIES: SIMPL domain-containing protein [Streptomycetaceae]|uniref:SIMPL domain-containing protein n=1 Tax=Streptantibioticus cattleyicolor (strain ATCC 35852 / DSM 46488 / JCM 4925 / NBRC 14057 / NRRL 8057) TaxID=1003195 RepID=F8JZS7_STREN|nr:MULTISPECIES: SIMPL domain-containing protein [Streptomycetaceae]AEW93509.1 hypothetical protein SCATT_11380 [Streptantibioticus cattleyicolor NRRL 8057 = DSM 46488]MYS58219.1 DUF541 domain-containing protein [Streptomyces sp. SID5468]CCB73861.1 conserved protein of unknown function [Streptantibioticus cattleyicolor NRRL 8057 = DSM 46488]
MTTPWPTGRGTEGTPHLAVRGEAHLEAEPELARLDVTITARGTDRHTVLADLTRRNTTALELIRGYGQAVTRLETGTLVVTPEPGKGRGERVRAHHGRVRLTADLDDFTVLGELAGRLADLDHTTLAGPWWSLRPDSPAHRTARVAAVTDAVRRAREYAQALGGELLALLELADEGTDFGAVPVPRAFGAMSTAAPGGGEGPVVLDLEPQRQTVRAQVTARFTMTPPDLRG